MKQTHGILQEQSISPQIIISSQILQCNINELWQYVYDEAIENPIIDLDATLHSKYTNPKTRKKINWLEKMSSRYSAHTGADDEKTQNQPWDFKKTSTSSLRSYLLEQLTSQLIEPLDKTQSSSVSRY